MHALDASQPLQPHLPRAVPLYHRLPMYSLLGVASTLTYQLCSLSLHRPVHSQSRTVSHFLLQQLLWNSGVAGVHVENRRTKSKLAKPFGSLSSLNVHIQVNM